MKKRTIIYGTLIGITNVLLGSCGGILAVQSLKQSSLTPTKAHATSIAVILPLSIASAVIYLINNDINIADTTIYIIPGLAGAVIGSIVLSKINSNALKKIFSIFIIYSGVRMFFK